MRFDLTMRLIDTDGQGMAIQRIDDLMVETLPLNLADNILRCLADVKEMLPPTCTPQLILAWALTHIERETGQPIESNHDKALIDSANRYVSRSQC